ncbi:uncharacterized protein LOC117101076, partial [Anneissia japonica]|uniref:uncharacterized protein LOC117101076 n=1 Tax=Anneissia japonica TaxID=1529436 RepID=UPI001425A2BD
DLEDSFKTFGLYRDDGLGIINATPRQIENTKKDLCAIFNKHGLKITIEANKKIVNFLVITLNLESGKYMPYTKPNNTPLYVHNKSNHPPGILKNIPESINKRLSEISFDEESFNKAAPLYQQALDKSGYSHQLKFSTAQQIKDAANTRKHRTRNIIWYNPPFSKNVATNIGKTFLKTLDDEFPPNHTLHKIFNRNTIKISYSCMGNLKQNIDGHNKTTLSLKTEQPKTKSCNCRIPNDCPMSGRCLNKSVVYQATVVANNKTDQTYAGLTENAFKIRYNNHTASFRNPEKCNTELSKYIWELKDNNIDYTIKWKSKPRHSTHHLKDATCAYGK